MAHVRRCAAASVPVDARAGRSHAAGSGDRPCCRPARVVARRRHRRRAAARRRAQPDPSASNPAAHSVHLRRSGSGAAARRGTCVPVPARSRRRTNAGGCRARRAAGAAEDRAPLLRADTTGGGRQPVDFPHLWPTRCSRRGGGRGPTTGRPGGLPAASHSTPPSPPCRRCHRLAARDGPAAANAGAVHKMAVRAARARLAASAATPVVSNRGRGASSSPTVHHRHPQVHQERQHLHTVSFGGTLVSHKR